MENSRFKFRALMHSRGLDKYFVSDGLGVDSGLSCLFGFENEGLDKLNNVVLCSQKFIKEVKEDWWESDWVHTDNLQYTGLKDKNGIEIYEYMELDNQFEVSFSHGSYILTNISNGDIILLSDYMEKNNGKVEVTKEYTKI